MLTKVGNTLFFTFTIINKGVELWKSDGTSYGTFYVKDIYTGSAGSYPEKLTAVNNTLFFTADDGIHGRILWKSDGSGSGTDFVKEVFFDSDQDYPTNLFNFDGKLMFWMGDDEHGLELWTSNSAGDPDSTFMVQDINTGIEGSLNSWVTNMAYIGDKLFFPAKDSDHGNELWCMTTEITAITENTGNTNAPEVYPNPNTGNFSIIAKGSEITGYQICDIYGKIVLSDNSGTKRSGILSVNMNNIQQGIYIVRIFTKEDIIIRKVIIE